MILEPASMSEKGTDDAAFIELVQNGDQQAFEPLVERHLDHIHAFISLKLPIPHLVDELTHETFVFAFRRIMDFRPDTTFRGWLRAIAWNKVRAEIERYCREERNRLAYAEKNILQEAFQTGVTHDSQELDALEQCLSRVPPHLRELLGFKYTEGASSAQIASRLHRSVSWVRTTLCRVRQQLKECMERSLESA